MAQATKRPVTKPAPQRPAQQAARPAQTKAQQAAATQGRQAPAPRTAPAQPQRSQVPAPRVQKATGREVAEYGNSAQLPDFMRDDAGIGKENIGKDDLETPRLKLMQGTSKELQLYNDLRPGHFFHTAAEHIFDGPFRAVLVYMDRRYILWRPLEDGGGILARADDGVHWSPADTEFTVKLDRKDGGHEVSWKTAKTVQQSGLANWGTMNPNDSNSPPAATLMYTYVLAFPDYPDLMPAAFTFQRSSIKVGRRLNTKLKTVRTPLFGGVWQFAAVEDSNGANQTFYNVSVTGDGLVTDKNDYMQYRQLHESFASAGLTVKDLEGLQEEETTDDDDEGSEEGGKPRY